MSIFDPESWLDVAELCCEPEPGTARQAHLRTALNRAYYAALLTTKGRIEQAFGGRVLPRAGTHHAILRAVNSGGPTFERIHFVLKRLKWLRERADYELATRPLKRRMVRSQLELTRTLIQRHIKALPDAEYRKLTL